MALDYTNGPSVMMQLGSFKFGVTTAAYQELKRTTEWRWPAQDQFGRLAAVQYVGPGNDTISLPGVIFPEYRGGLTLLDDLRDLGDTGEPQTMIDGRGNIIGKFVIERVEEVQQAFASAGVPRKQEFTLNLRRIHDESLEEEVSTATVAASAKSPSIPSTATTQVEQLTGLADSIASASKTMQGEIAAAMVSVKSAMGTVSGLKASVVGAVQRCSDVAGGMLAAANRARALVGQRPITITAVSQAAALASKARSSMSMTNSAGVVLRNSVSQLEAIAGAPQAAISAFRSAAATADKLATMCRNTSTEADKIK